MIGTARDLSEGALLHSDLVVVGAGPAGITLALEVARSGRDVILLEAGGLDRSGTSQGLYRGELLNPRRHLPLDRDRYRQLGGTTALWGGRCIPFDRIDFEPRDYVPFSGWPLQMKDMEPYYHQAARYCECGPYLFDREQALPDAPPDMISGLSDSAILTSTIERWSPPTHFGKRYRKDLEASNKIRVYLHAVVTGIDLSEDGRRVVRLSGHTLSGGSFFIVAKQTVIAGGGLETTRLLLTASATHPEGIGNHSDWLGRGYMCHVSGVAAKVSFVPGTRVVFGYEKDVSGVYCRRRLWPTEQAQRRLRILNSYLLLDRPLLSDPGHRSALLSLTYLAKSVLAKTLEPTARGGKYGLYVRHLRNLLLGSPELLMVLPKWSRERFLQDRRIPSMLAKSSDDTYYLYYHTEQIPNPDSRVSLGTDRDPLGIPRLKVDYRFTDTDIESIYQTHRLFAKELERARCGTLNFLAPDPRAQIAEHRSTLGHHIGTTRMSQDPSGGVVDANCRVHGIDNLYLASSSVFPTSSQANPVLTILALSIRLAAHLIHESAHDNP